MWLIGQSKHNYFLDDTTQQEKSPLSFWMSSPVQEISGLKYCEHCEKTKKTPQLEHIKSTGLELELRKNAGVQYFLEHFHTQEQSDQSTIHRFIVYIMVKETEKAAASEHTNSG